jgi:hypothetical protein
MAKKVAKVKSKKFKIRGEARGANEKLAIKGKAGKLSKDF